MAETRRYPPHELTEDEAIAVVGRFVMNATPQPDPVGSGVYGREQAPPHGVYYVRAEVFDEVFGTPEEET